VKKKFKKIDRDFLCGDLFGGAGGLSLGFRLSGYDTVFFNEIDEKVSETHALNFKESIPFVCPIENLRARDIMKEINCKSGELDIIIGGPPCQGFSINAPARTSGDPRNGLFQHYVRLVLEGLKPKFVLMENVPGLISLDKGKTLKKIVESFNMAGYKIVFKILNSAHYGVPEERWRLFILGTRLPNFELSLPEPTHYSLQRTNFTGGKDFTFRHAIGKPKEGELFSSDLKSPVTIEEAIGDLPSIDSGGGADVMPYSNKAASAYQRMVRKGSAKIYNHQSSALSDINKKRLKHVSPGGSWREIPFDLLPRGLKRARRSDHTKRYGRLDPKSLSGTIMTKCDPHWGTFFHYDQDRVISVREAARIQSFPDYFRFTGTRTDQYKAVGNAVPPLLAKAVADHIQQCYLKYVS
jgi:DNA (cytosine-5)-methyltransferase 1